MTLYELSRHLKLREQLEQDEEILVSLKEKAYPGAQNLSGMPHAPGVRDKVGDLAVEIADMEYDIERLKVKIKSQEDTVISFINQIEDSRVRLVFRLRFIRGKTWKEVAYLLGGRNTEEGVKSTCYRYLEDFQKLHRRNAP